MKQKFVRIGLGVLVLLVWGAVVGRAIRNKPPENAVEIERPRQAQADTVTAVGPIVFALARDPFLGTSTGTTKARTGARTEQPTQRRSKPQTKVDPSPTPPPVAKHRVEYLGFIKNAGTTGTACVIMGIDGRDHLITVGKELMGISVTQATPEVVTILQGGTEEVLRIAR